MQFIPESFRLLSGKKINQNWGLDDGYELEEGSDYSISFSDNYTKFKMTIFNPSGKPFILDYKTTAPGDGSTVGNVISVQGDDKPLPNNAVNNSTKEEVRRRSSLTEGGAIQLNVAYRIVINKVDAETKKPLAGAVFKVTDPDGNEFRLAPTGTDGSTISDKIKDTLAAKGTFKIQEETAPAGYELSNDVTEVTVTETGVIRTIENKKRSTGFKATKVWAGDQDASKRPSVKFQLKRDGANYGDVKDVPKAGGVVTWSNLPYYQDGKTDPSVYTVEETGVEGTGYEVAYSNQTATSATVTNTYRSTEFKATKVWAGDQDATKRPAAKFQLKRDGANYGDAKDVPQAGGEVTWSNLPYYQDGKTDPSVYTVEETGIEGTGYEVAYSNQTATSATVTNTYRTTEFKVTKVWAGDQDASKRPSVKFQLKRDGANYGEAKDVPKEGGLVTWTNLPYYQDGKTEASVYTVEELTETPNGYEVTYTSDANGSVTVTNTFKTTGFVASKVWKGDKDSSVRPQAQFQLYRDGVAYGQPQAVPTVDGQVAWTNLPYYQEGKNEASVYTVQEVQAVDSPYAATYADQTASTVTVTNTLQNKTTNFTVNKQWRGFGADMKRPNAKFQLKRDGQAYGELRDVPKEDGQVVWTDLPLYQDGTTTPSVYTVDELDPSNEGGYEWKVEDLTATSAKIINYNTANEKPPTPPTPSGKRELPKTGEQDTILTGLAGLSLLLAATYVISPVRRRN